MCQIYDFQTHRNRLETWKDFYWSNTETIDSLAGAETELGPLLLKHANRLKRPSSAYSRLIQVDRELLIQEFLGFLRFIIGNGQLCAVAQTCFFQN